MPLYLSISDFLVLFFLFSVPSLFIFFLFLLLLELFFSTVHYLTLFRPLPSLPSFSSFFFVLLSIPLSITIPSQSCYSFLLKFLLSGSAPLLLLLLFCPFLHFSVCPPCCLWTNSPWQSVAGSCIFNFGQGPVCALNLCNPASSSVFLKTTSLF